MAPPKVAGGGVDKRRSAATAGAAAAKGGRAGAGGSIDAIRAQIESTLGDVSAKLDQSSRELNQKFKAQVGALEAMAEKHYQETAAAQQSANAALESVNESHAAVASEIGDMGKRLAASLQSSTRSTLAAAQEVAARVSRDAAALASAQQQGGGGGGAKAGGAGVGGAAERGGDRGGGRGARKGS
ncbi:hypothetical protein Rsub_06964 [Raphidocelis subcapitata]|uniref:Uncharacterized protein n=1 Tax=Raphidocelis subcapitata TaxID=307507 RepID=A0A2V0P5Y4_9CHLO|nr:hypothetical protein Rsub_06964 [Raphidocelis subcapitata]|eukprot:GBF94342.1 hypothetical protein Rsub_06964 [Raphidocelis subcapitata]